MNRLACSLNNDFSFIKSITYNKMQFDIYKDHSTQNMAFVYVNPETECLKEIIYGLEDKYFYETIEEISSYFDTHKVVESYLELCRKLKEEEEEIIRKYKGETNVANLQ